MIGERLKLLRNEKGYTQQELAALLDVSYQAVGHWEKGSNDPNNDLLIKIASLFCVTTDYLLGVENEREKVQKAAELFSDMNSEAAKNKIQQMLNDGMSPERINQYIDIAKQIAKIPPVK